MCESVNYDTQTGEQLSDWSTAVQHILNPCAPGTVDPIYICVFKQISNQIN